MSTETLSLSPQQAAEAFYGQSDQSFAAQLKQMGAVDPKLVKAFQRTREHYLKSRQN